MRVLATRSSCAVAVCLLFLSVSAFAAGPGSGAKGDLTYSAIYIDQPEALEPQTMTQFEFRVKFLTSDSSEWLQKFEVDLPFAYTSITATDPEPVYQPGEWSHTVSGSTVRFQFWNSNWDGYGLPWGDARSGQQIVFRINARTDSVPTNNFVCRLYADMGGTLIRTRWVGAPDVVRSSPEHLRLADPTAPFELEFASAVEEDSFAYDISPDPGGVELTWNSDHTIATIAHDELNSNREFTLRITNAANDEGHTANPFSATFFTKSATWDSVYTPNPPICDGLIIPGEWDAALAEEIGIDGHEVTLYLMNDLSALYLALDAPSDTVLKTNDQIIFYFDENGDGVFPEEGDPSEEGNYWVIYFEGEPVVVYRGLYGDYFGDGLEANDDIETSHGVEAFFNFNVNSGNVQLEFCPNFGESFFNPTPGGSFGMVLGYFDNVGTARQPEWVTLGETPNAFFSYNPETYRTINLAQAPAPEVYSIDPNQGRTNLTTEVTIKGLYFDASAQAFVGEYELVTTQVVDSSTITGLVRSSLPVDCYDVIVRNPDGAQGVLENGFAICDRDGNCPDCEQPDDDTDDDVSDDDEATGDDDDDDDDGCGC